MEKIPNLILVTTENDRTNEQSPKMMRLCLSYCIGSPGNLERRYLPFRASGCLMGVSDLNSLSAPVQAEIFVQELLSEMQKVGYRGLFLDIEQNRMLLQEVLQLSDKVCAAKNIPLYVPIECAPFVKNAVIVAETAISGGSLLDRFGTLCQSVGKNRVAAFLSPISVDFSLPNNSNHGIPIPPIDREALQKQVRAQSYFSKELCAKYFTYTDKAGDAHFVLYDDESTLQEKMRQLSDLDIADYFILCRHVGMLSS